VRGNLSLVAAFDKGTIPKDPRFCVVEDGVTSDSGDDDTDRWKENAINSGWFSGSAADDSGQPRG
jgi:hypothetical protein